MASARVPPASAAPRAQGRGFLSWGRRPVAAVPTAPSARLTAALDRAERALSQSDLETVWGTIAPLEGEGRRRAVGRVLELCGLCAAAGLGEQSSAQAKLWLTEALWAHQNAKDVTGMARAHRALGMIAAEEGQLDDAIRELGYAQTLLGRQGDSPLRVTLARLMAELRLMRGELEPAAQSISEAVAASMRGQLVEAEALARLCLAEIFVTGAAKPLAARELLWAERLAASVRHQGGQLSIALRRAETLLRMGCVRRATAVLLPWQQHDALMRHPSRLAHWRRLWGMAHIQDQPTIARGALTEAYQFFAARRLAYLRTACELHLLRVDIREGEPAARAAIEELAGRGASRWPLLGPILELARFELAHPTGRALGAVKTPWSRAVGRVETRARGQDTAADRESYVDNHASSNVSPRQLEHAR